MDSLAASDGARGNAGLAARVGTPMSSARIAQKHERPCRGQGRRIPLR